MTGSNLRRRVQVVSTKAQRKKVILWMIARANENGTDKNIVPEAVAQFPAIFCQKTSKSNQEKARRWWNGRHSFLSLLEEKENKALYVVRRKIGGPAVRRIGINALTGRGRKRRAWKNTVHSAVLDEFTRLRSAGVKVDRQFLLQTVLSVVHDANVPTSVADIENQTGKSIDEVLTLRWVDDFCDMYQIVTRRRTGNKTLSPERIARNKKFLSHHLGVIKRMYEDGLDPSSVENYDETHMVLDLDNGQVLDFQGKKQVSYADVSSGRDCFTVCFRISAANGGKIEKPVIIFQNPNSSYPIAGIPDNIDGVTYRSSPKGWMSQDLFANYFADPRIISHLPFDSVRKLWIDSCRVHNHTELLQSGLESCRTELIRFQPNCTSLAQPLDQLLLRCFKAEWRKRWYSKRNELVAAAEYTGSGRVPNPGKHYYLKLVRDVVEDLNSRTHNGMSLAKSSLVMCGLIPGPTGVWSVEQLTPELREIVNSNLPYFEGQDPNS